MSCIMARMTPTTHPTRSIPARPRILAHAILAAAAMTPLMATLAEAAPVNSPIAAIQDDRLGLDQGNMPAERFAQLAKLGARLTRVDLHWDRVATRKPVNAANPADPAYDWSWYDKVVAASTAANIPILFTVFGTPTWAGDPTVPATESTANGSFTFGPDSRRPQNAEDFGAFGRAVALRYGPLGVHRYEAWNEPNIPLFFRPQFAQDGGAWKNVSVAAYSKLAKSFYENVKAVDPAAVIAGGVTAPSGDRCPGSCPTSSLGRTAPVDFVTELGKVGNQPPMDAIAHHPYALRLPPKTTFAGAAYVDLYNLNFLYKAADATYLKGKPFWLTEFGFNTEKTANFDKLVVSPKQQATLLSDTYLRLRLDPRIQLASWYFLQDNPNWKSGLVDLNGQEKPAAQSFAFPVASTLVGKRKRNFLILGQARPAAAATKVTIERKVAGRYRPFRTLTTTADGSFALVGPLAAKAQVMHAVWASPSGARYVSAALTIPKGPKTTNQKRPRRKG